MFFPASRPMVLALSSCSTRIRWFKAGLLAGQAHAGLLGAGKTVQAFYYNGVFASPEGELTDPLGTSNPTSLASPVDYIQGAANGSTIDVGDTQIVITNLLSGLPFCVSGQRRDRLHRPDRRVRLQVHRRKHSRRDGRPRFGRQLPARDVRASHLGLQLLSNNEIQVDVTGELPLVNDQLILDLTFAVGATTASTASTARRRAGAGYAGAAGLRPCRPERGAPPEGSLTSVRPSRWRGKEIDNHGPLKRRRSLSPPANRARIARAPDAMRRRCRTPASSAVLRTLLSAPRARGASHR